MKKILTVLAICCLSYTTFAQSDIICIVFQESTNTENMIRHTARENYNTQLYRDQPHTFSVKQGGVIRHFSYANLHSQPDEPVQTQPVSFLKSIDNIDWNNSIMNYSTTEFYNFLTSLELYDKVYFIDRAEIKDGMMILYPVKAWKSY